VLHVITHVCSSSTSVVAEIRYYYQEMSSVGSQDDGFKGQHHRNVCQWRHSDRWFTIEDYLVVILMLLVSVQSTHMLNLYLFTYSDVRCDIFR